MRKVLVISALLTIIVGIIMIGAGSWGIVFTYQNVARENIITPEDASIPNAKVRGPLTLKAQADIIRTHTLRMTGGKTFAEMPRLVPSLDKDGNPVLDESGKPVMVENQARNTWITATTLTTALNLAILTYASCGLAIIFGLVSLLTGTVFYLISRKY